MDQNKRFLSFQGIGLFALSTLLSCKMLFKQSHFWTGSVANFCPFLIFHDCPFNFAPLYVIQPSVQNSYSSKNMVDEGEKESWAGERGLSIAQEL